MTRIFEFRILHDGWEMDNAGWITEDETGRKLYTTGHGQEYEMPRDELSSLIQYMEENLARLREAARLMGYLSEKPALCGDRGMAGGNGCKLAKGHAGEHQY